jgi:cbb3-type cytochrome c oxidase subunit III
MRPQENYSNYFLTGIVLTLAILASFQLYIVREPERVAQDVTHDAQLSISEGKALFKRNCTICHGSDGEGDTGPALNDKTFLDTTEDGTLFSVISSGIPGTEMPAWNQSHGGPLTDENVRQLVAFLRSWQSTAVDRRSQPKPGDPNNGAQIYASVCAICHGDDGKGNDNGPALNDAEKLKQFDDAWYRDTINDGRPAQGMPTWGTVLSPQQVADLIAFINTWR